MVSYPDNLLRLADALLGFYDAQDRFHELQESALSARGVRRDPDAPVNAFPVARAPLEAFATCHGFAAPEAAG